MDVTPRAMIRIATTILLCLLLGCAHRLEFVHGERSIVEAHDAANQAIAEALQEMTGVTPYEEDFWITTGWLKGFDDADCQDPIAGLDYWERGECEHMIRATTTWKAEGKSEITVEAHFRQYCKFIATNELARALWEEHAGDRLAKGNYEEYLGEDSYEDGWRKCATRGRLEEQALKKIGARLEKKWTQRSTNTAPAPAPLAIARP